MIRLRVSSRFTRLSVLGSAAALLVLACSSGEGGEPSVPDDEEEGRIGEVRAQLTRVTSCDALLERLQTDLLVQLEQRAVDLRLNAGGGGRGDVAVPGNAVGGGGVVAEDGAADPGPAPPPVNPSVPTDSAGTPNGAPAPDAPESQGESAGPSGSGGSGGAGGGGFSGTTVQVEDVDEADILKADGDRLFLLHGGTLFVLQAWPAESTEILGSTLLEGTPSEMFVEDGKAVVFSQVYGVGANESGAYDGYYGSWGFTKITVLDVSDDAPSVLSESWVEGNYVSSRRHDDLVRAVVQEGFKVPSIGYPNIEYYDFFGNRFPQADIDAQVDAWLERTERVIRTTTIDSYLPREFTRQGGELVQLEPRCGDYFVPDDDLTEPGVTSLVSLDLNQPDARLGGASILGRAERVYANRDVVLVTQTDYRWQTGQAETEQTLIHRFDVDGDSTTYTASGFIPGHINDQFSLDELDGIVRVSTTENRWNRGVGAVPVPAVPPEVVASDDVPVTSTVLPAPVDGPVNRVLTLRVDGDELVQLGATEEFGLTERIYATRFIGDRGYVVTFRQTDPFFVVDLSDPASPAIVGELKIPGFSNFLFPLGPDHLFAIGRDATEQGFVQGLALQIFDVSDPTNPVLAHPKYVFPEQGASEANFNHRAISFHAERDLVSFPYESYETGESRLEVFRVSANDGISRIGDMQTNAPEPSFEECLVRMGYGNDPATIAEIEAQAGFRDAILRECRYYFDYVQFRRGVFRDDVVYGITNRGVQAFSLDALDGEPLASVSLPTEVYDQGGSGGYPMPGIPRPAPPPIDVISEPSMGGAAGAGAGGSAGAAMGGSAGSAMAGVAGGTDE